MKVVINKCYGGFNISNKAFERLIELGMSVSKDGEKPEGDILNVEKSIGLSSSPMNYCFRYKSSSYWMRAHPLVIQVVEELGEEANGMYARLSIVEVPDDVEWDIDEYDGMEHIAEKHRTWG